MAEINLTMYVVLRPEELVCGKNVEEFGIGGTHLSDQVDVELTGILLH